MAGRLTGLNVVVTRADLFMGPAVVELFRSEGAYVVCRRARALGARRRR